MADSIKKRVATAVVLVAILVAVLLLLPPAGTVVALVVLVLAGAWEWSAFLKPTAFWQRALYVAIVAALLWGAWVFAQSASGLTIIFSVAAVWWVVALCWVMFAPKLVSSTAAAIAGILALVPAWLALMRLRLDFVYGAEWVLFTLALVQFADIGAFFVGRRFGRHRLAPNVSPGKTWEGVVGGIIASALVAFAGSAYFGVQLSLFLPLCLAVVAFSIVGDLTESLLKRFAGLKDSGRLFPGHGGVMDRIDSVTAAAPLLFFGLMYIGVPP